MCIQYTVMAYIHEGGGGGGGGEGSMPNLEKKSASEYLETNISLEIILYVLDSKV